MQNNANKDSEVLELHLQARNGIDKAQLEYLTLPQDNSIKSYGLCQNSGEKGRVVFSDKDDGATNGVIVCAFFYHVTYHVWKILIFDAAFRVFLL